MTELLSLIGVAHRSLARGARHAHGSGGTAQPGVVEMPHADLKAVTLLSNPVLLGNFEVLKR